MLWAAIAIGSFLWSTWALLAVVLVTVLWKYLKFKQRRQINGLVEAARTTYHTFEARTFSWDVALDHMKKIRDFSTEDWTGELYRLVESRRASQIAHDQSEASAA